ncbi:MAG: gliding motility-associated C-terminal domain-containing protein, partial [Bacteroidetes bacterium]
GCLAALECFQVLDPPAIQVGVSITDVTCTEGGRIALQISGGTPDSLEGYVIIWDDQPGIQGEAVRTDLSPGTYGANIFDGNGCLVKVVVQVANTCDPGNCSAIFPITSGTLEVPYCEDARLCLPITFEAFEEWLLTDNGAPFDGLVLGCDFDSVFTYTYGSLPAAGLLGPYRLDAWTVNGTTFSGTFNDLQHLLDAMNAWDPTGNWQINPQTQTLMGGSPNNSYGDMRITQISTGIITVLVLNANIIPNGTAIQLAPGPHDLHIVNTLTGCADSASIFVRCGVVHERYDTLLVGTDSTFCFEAAWLPGTQLSILNECPENAGELLVPELHQPNCVSIQTLEPGDEALCILLCDDLGFCDTTFWNIHILQDTTGPPPVAVDDSDDTFVDNPVTVPVLDNDTLNGELLEFYLLEEPQFGIVVFNADGTVTYAPFGGFCDANEPDRFVYEICNANGCDQATVFITVDCEELTIFSGFSPNGDGVNDTFTIRGVHRFPDNQLIVFNRWGNEVYRARNYQNDWDGTWNGKLLPDATYFYIFEDGRGNKYTGYVQIHR